MRLRPTSRSFLLGLAIGAASILALGFLDMWINDEGKVNGLPLNTLASVLAIVCEAGLAAGDYIAGPAVLAGFNEEGETVALPPEWMDLIAAIA